MRRFAGPTRRALLAGAAAVPFLARRAAAAEVTVMTSGGLTAAYRLLGPDFERATAVFRLCFAKCPCSEVVKMFRR